MPHDFRYVPDPDTLFEVTSRARDGLFAFAPTVEVVNEWVGVLSVACERWPQVRVHQLCVLSNHVHMILSVTGSQPVNQWSRWSSFVFANTARISHRRHRLTGPIWARRFRAIPIVDDAAVLDRTRYVMAQAVSAGLVFSPRHWPGLNSVDAVCRGKPIQGYRVTAAIQRRARTLGIPVARLAEPRVLTLSALPIHRGWPEHKRRAWYRRIERQIIDDAMVKQTVSGQRFGDPERLREVPATTTKTLAASEAPGAHVGEGNSRARQEWRAAMAAFVEAWRTALLRWVDGLRPCFPVGGWLPFAGCGTSDVVLRQ